MSIFGICFILYVGYGKNCDYNNKGSVMLVMITNV